MDEGKINYSRKPKLWRESLFDRPLRYFLGLLFLNAWFQTIYAGNALLLSPAQLPPLYFTHLFSTLAVIVTSLVCMVFAIRLTPISGNRRLLYLLAALGSLATVGISVVSTGLVASQLVIVCISIAAAAGAVLTLAWIEVFATQGVRGAIVAYAINAICGSILSLLIVLLPQQLALPLNVLLPVFAIIALRPANNQLVARPAYDRKNQAQALFALMRKTPWQFVLVAGIMSFAMGAVRTSFLPVSPFDSATAELLFNIVMGVIAYVVAIAVAFISSQRNIAIAFYIAIPFIALASLLLAFPVLIAPTIAVSATAAGVDIVHLLVWLLLIAAVTQKNIPVAFSFALLSAAQFAGLLLGQLTAVATNGNHNFISLAVLVVLLAATLVVIAARKQLPTQDDANARQSNPVAELCDRYGLSPREREVIAIWLSGYTGAYIEKTLNISKNTVKTHLSHIYSKTNTANKQELLDLLNRF